MLLFYQILIIVLLPGIFAQNPKKLEKIQEVL